MSNLLIENMRNNAGINEEFEINEDLLIEGLVFFKKSKRLKRLVTGLKKKLAKKPSKAGEQLISDLEAIVVYYKQLEDKYKYSKGDAKKEVRTMYKQSNVKFASYLKHLQQKEIKDMLVAVGALALVAATILMILSVGPTLGGFMSGVKAKVGLGAASGTGNSASIAAQHSYGVGAHNLAAGKQALIDTALEKSHIYTNMNTPINKVLTPAMMNGLEKTKFTTLTGKKAITTLKDISTGAYGSARATANLIK